MSDQFSLSKSAFVQVLDLLFILGFPNPDDTGPLGPAGPVISPSQLVRLPAGGLFGPSPEPWGPHPEPWRSIAATRAAIDRSVGLVETAGIIIVSGDTSRAVDSAAMVLNRFVDDFCGTPPHHGPFPGPWGPVLDSETLHPVNLVIAGGQFLKAAESLEGHPLQGTLRDAADRLLETGLGRLAERHTER